MIPRQISVEEIARKLKPILGKKIDEVYFRYLNSENLEEKNETVQLLTGLYQKYLTRLLDKDFSLEPPKKDSLIGEYPLAEVSYAGKKLFSFSLREKDFPRHICVTGMSGSGKTTFALNILNNFIEKKKPFLVFDWKKSFRPVITKDANVMCFTLGNESVSNLFKTNINRPPKGVSPKEWINTLCDLLTETFNVSFGVHKILLETLDETFQGWGVYEGSNLYPNWEHVKRMLEIKAKESKGRETGWYESALRVATVLTFGDFGKVVNYDGKKSLPIEDLFDKRVIFELNSLSNIEKKFFCEYVLTYIYKLKKAGSEKLEGEFNHAIVVDEAHNIFLKRETSFMSESVTDMIYREMREYGTSLICLDQHASKLSDTVIGNSACHVAFQQQLPQDVDEISSLMQLRDRKEIFMQLPVGSAIVKLSERYTSPFLIEVPFTDLRNISYEDSKIKSKMKAVIEGLEIEKNDPEFLKNIKNPQDDKMEISGNEKIEEIIVEGNNEVDKLNITKNRNLGTIKIRNNNDLDEIKIDSNENLERIIIHSNNELDKVKIFDNRNEIGSLTKTQEVLLEFAQKKFIEGKTLNEVERLLDSGTASGYYSKKDVLIVVNKILSEKLKIRPIEQTKNVNEFKLQKDESSIVEFLINNPSHLLSTVEVYKLAGLSSRKGNVIKDNLLKKGIIKIIEERNKKGWKKLLRLNSYSTHLNEVSKIIVA